ncbi:MAG: hypothetical protein V4722_22350 [Bacteroidota bacterium]
MKFSNLPVPGFLMLFAILLLAGTTNLCAQTTWTGAVSTAWNTAGNWSAGVPDAADDVLIPNVANDPVISAAGAVARYVQLSSLGMLTINAAGSLNINGSGSFGIYNGGSVQNSGTINIGATIGAPLGGIQNYGSFNNNSGANINIDRVTDVNSFGIANSGASFTNAGTITIGGITGGGANGLYVVDATFNNTAGGILNISNTSKYGVYSDIEAGNLSNAGIINIGLAGSATIPTGIYCRGNFINSTGGLIKINRSVNGIEPVDLVFNSGTINIGEDGALPGFLVVSSPGILTNNPGSTFKGNGTVALNSFVNTGGTLSGGKLTLNNNYSFTNSIVSSVVNGTSITGVDYGQVIVNGTAVLGGTLALSVNYTPSPGDQAVLVSANAISGTFANVTGVPPNWSLSYNAKTVTLTYQLNTWTGNVNTDWSTAGNWTLGVPLASGSVTIPNVTNDPVISNGNAVAKAVKVQSGAVLTVTAAGVLSVNGTGSFAPGLWNQGTVANSGTIRTGNTASTGDYGIYNEGTINNNSGGLLQADRANTAGIFLFAGTVSNSGTFTVGSLVPIPNLVTSQTGIFNNNNNGTVRGTGNLSAAGFVQNGGRLAPGYSPGKMTFDNSENFSNGFMNMEVNGTGVPGVNYDQVALAAGTATLGGILALSINYTPSPGDEVVLVSANAISGTFANVTGLLPNWSLIYSAKTVTLKYPLNTWTGNVSTDWNTAGNWTLGVPLESGSVTIPNVTNDPVISNGNAVARGVKVQAGALLTIGAGGVLSVNGESSFASGLWNQGTVDNVGTIRTGNTASTGDYGVYNEGTFNNYNGSFLQVDRANTAGIFLFAGTVSNAGTVTIGSLVAITNLVTSQTGIFNNNTNGTVKGTGNLSAAGFVNNGGSLAPGYSPGKMTFDNSENFTNNYILMEVNGTGVPGINYDQLTLTSGTATLGGLLAVYINYTPVEGDQVTLMTAPAISGQFPIVYYTVTNWKVSYTPTAVLLTYSAFTTWTGAVSTDWYTWGNWTNGVPVAKSIVTIPNVTNDPVISTAGAEAHSLTLQTGALLTVKSTGSLKIYKD